MKRILLFFGVLSIVCISINAQSIVLRELYAIAPLSVKMPAEIDSVDRNGKKFTAVNLLRMKLTIPGQDVFTHKYEADTDGFFHFSQPQNPFVLLFSFYVSAEAYGKAKVKVTATDMLEIYLDDKLAASKTATEESVQQAKSVTAEFSPYPNTCRIVIKLLHTEDNTNPSLKIELEDISSAVLNGIESSGTNTNIAENSETNSPSSSRTNTNVAENSGKDNPVEKPFTNTAGRLSVSYGSQRKITLDDIIKGTRITGTSVSSSGKYVLIHYTVNYGARSSSLTELYTVKTCKRVTVDTDNRKRQLAWMPVSDRMYYLQKDGEKTNLISIRPETLEETTMAADIPDERITFSPDEQSLFYSKAEKETAKNDDVFRLHTLTIRTGGQPSHAFIYRYDLKTGLTQQLTFGSHATFLNDISTDGKKLLFSTSDETITEHPFRKSSMFRLDIETMQTDTLWIGEKFASRAQFSPDGNDILILGAPEAFGGTGLNVGEGHIANSYDTQAFLMNLAAKTVEPLTKDFNPSVKNAGWSLPDGLIYLLTTDEDYAAVYTCNPATKKFNRLPSDEDVINNFQIADLSPVLVYDGVSVSNSTRAYVCDLKTKKHTCVADPYAEQLSHLKLGEVRDFNFTNSDGVEIKGYYYLPPDFDTEKKYPLIVNYYGGTTPTERTFESRYPKHVYAALGYVVYVLQPGGTTGFGQEFSALHVNTWGKRSSDDIIEGTEHFIAAHPFVDAKKIGCIGASYGGFMTMYLQTRTDLFAAAVSHAGISSISSYWGEGYWGYSYSAAASAHSYPWNSQDLYVNQSPLFSADKIHTPLLLLHGTDDTNVPVGESIQMYTALKILGKPVELVQVKGEDHHILSYEKRLKWNSTIFAWFDRWLKNEPAWWDSLYNE
jgi:dipeptidyl aminopeptidase/acylaminoacyl peptidase